MSLFQSRLDKIEQAIHRIGMILDTRYGTLLELSTVVEAKSLLTHQYFELPRKITEASQVSLRGSECRSPLQTPATEITWTIIWGLRMVHVMETILSKIEQLSDSVQRDPGWQHGHTTQDLYQHQRATCRYSSSGSIDTAIWFVWACSRMWSDLMWLKILSIASLSRTLCFTLTQRTQKRS